MSDPSPLPLHEEVLLLALRDEEGTIASGTMPQVAIGAAVLAELLLRERIAIAQEGKKRFVEVRTTDSTGDLLLDECLERIAGAKRRERVQTWVSRFANRTELKHRVAARLCERGILRLDEDKVLLLFKRKVYPEVDPKPEEALVERLREAIFTDRTDLDTRTVVLVALAHAASLLNVVFDKRDLKDRKDRIQDVVEGHAVGEAAKKVVDEIQAAIFVSVIMPSIMTTTIH